MTAQMLPTPPPSSQGEPDLQESPMMEICRPFEAQGSQALQLSVQL